MAGDHPVQWWCGLVVSWVGFLMVMVGEGVLAFVNNNDPGGDAWRLAEKTCFGVGYGLHFVGMLALLTWHHESRLGMVLRNMLGYTAVTILFIASAAALYEVQLQRDSSSDRLARDLEVSMSVIIMFGMFHALGAGVVLGRNAIAELGDDEEATNTKEDDEQAALLRSGSSSASAAQSYLPEGATSPYLLYWASCTIAWVAYAVMVIAGIFIAWQVEQTANDSYHVALYTALAVCLTTASIGLIPYYTKLNRRRLYRTFAHNTFVVAMRMSVVFYFACLAGSFRQPGFTGLLTDGYFMLVFSSLWMLGVFLTFGFAEVYRKTWGHYPFDVHAEPHHTAAKREEVQVDGDLGLA